MFFCEISVKQCCLRSIDFIEKRGLSLEICDLSDILPTLVDYAGGELPEGHRFDGKSLKPFLTGESDVHRDTIMGVIGGTRLARSRTHMLEVVNDLLGVPEGRFYYTGNNAGGKDYARAESNPEHKAAMAQLWTVMIAIAGRKTVPLRHWNALGAT